MDELRRLLGQAGSIQAAVFGLIAASPLVSAFTTIGVARGFSTDYMTALTFTASLAGFAAIGWVYFDLAPQPTQRPSDRLRVDTKNRSGDIVFFLVVAIVAFGLYYYLGSNGNPLAIVALTASSFCLFAALTTLALLLAIRSEQTRILAGMTPEERDRFDAETKALELAEDEDPEPVWRREVVLGIDLVRIGRGQVPPTNVEESDVEYYAVEGRRLVLAASPLNAASARAILDALGHLRERPIKDEPWLTVVVGHNDKVTSQAVALLEDAGVEFFREPPPEEED